MHLEKLTIQEVAEANGLNAHPLHYDEGIGLIHPKGREENTRHCTAEDINWIDFLTRLRATGKSIRAMQKYAELQRRGDETPPIPGFKIVAQAEENARALEFGLLVPEQMKEVDTLLGR